MKNGNKKFIFYFEIFFVTILLVAMTFSSFVSADNNDSCDCEQQITRKYSFDLPYMSQVVIDDNVYNKIIMPNSSGIGNPGEPNLPVHEVRLLLPPELKVKEINVIPGEKIFLASDFIVEPVGKPAKLSDIELFSNSVRNESIYSSNYPFPGKLFSEIGTYSFRGHEILVMMLYPVQYIPNTGKLYYFKEMTISIKTVEKNQINPLFRNTKNDGIELSKKIDNPLSIAPYTKKLINSFSPNDYDLLILTIDEFKGDFEPLKDSHNAEGIKTEIKTLGDISFFPGSVTAEDIREFIKNEYINSGIEYVLLGGDADIIPAKNLYFGTYNSRDFYGPSDLYYSCLDGTFNFDGDERWGESTDGENGGDIDLVAEIYIGRACVGDATEIEHFVDKTKTYIEFGGQFNKTSLMVGEKLFSEPVTWGGDYLDEIINESSVNMYSTTGFPLGKYTIDTLYDRDLPDQGWATSEIIDKINSGAHIINHIGHSSYGYTMKMYKDDILSLSNNEPFFVYSQGCNSGGFDNEDCIAEYLNVKTEYGAFAGIWNARYGWASMGSTNGASQRFQREFWDAVFGEGITEIGKANQDSKEDILYQINYPYIRWCYYQLNLLGDPTLSFYSNENNPPIKPARPSGVTIGRTGRDYNFETTSSDEDGDMIYYRWDFGDETFSDWIGPFESGETANVSHSWSKLGKYQIKVKTRDEHRAESEWSYQLIVRIPFYNNVGLLNLIVEFLEKYFPELGSIYK